MAETTQRLITGYVPKLALTGVGIACFALLAAACWFNYFRHGQKYMLVLCISLLCMTAGFGIRVPMTNNPGSLGIYIGQYMFILLSPCGFLAQSYMILPRLATWLDAEDCLFLKSRIIVRLFVWADVVTFLVQASGGGMTAVQSESMANIGKWISIVGLVVQAGFFITFTCLCLIFGLRVRSRYPKKWSSTAVGPRASGNYATIQLSWREDWRSIYWALLYSCIGILVRCVFRIVEFAQGYDGELRTVEVWFYVLDTLPLALAMLVWTFVWPPVVMNQPSPFNSDADGLYRMDPTGSPTRLLNTGSRGQDQSYPYNPSENGGSGELKGTWTPKQYA